MWISPQFTAFTLEQQDEEWAAEDSGDHSHGNLGGSEECARKRIAQHEESGTHEKRGRDQSTMIGSGNKANCVRDDKADEADRPAECRHGAGEDRANEINQVFDAAYMNAV